MLFSSRPAFAQAPGEAGPREPLPLPSQPTSQPAPAAEVRAAPPNRVVEEEYAKGVDGAPPPRTGFQLALRSGVAIPLGSISKGSAMSDAFSPQVPFVIDIGGKPIPNLFIGAYVGFAVGGAGGKFADACSKANATCVGVGFRVGVEAQYHFSPDEKLDPWVGYGIGFAGEGVSGSSSGGSTSYTAAGPEYGHFSGGLDVRLGKTIGVGPMVDFGIGRFTHAKVEVPGLTAEGDVSDTTLHEWLTLGLRVVVLP